MNWCDWPGSHYTQRPPAGQKLNVQFIQLNVQHQKCRSTLTFIIHSTKLGSGPLFCLWVLLHNVFLCKSCLLLPVSHTSFSLMVLSCLHQSQLPAVHESVWFSGHLPVVAPAVHGFKMFMLLPLTPLSCVLVPTALVPDSVSDLTSSTA